MNFQRGLFRLWAVFGVIFGCFVFALYFSALEEQFNQPKDFKISQQNVVMLPVDCAVARGIQGKDYEKIEPWKMEWEVPPPEGLKVPGCWYKLSSLRSVFPEYKDIPDDTLIKKTYEKRFPPTAPWAFLFQVICYAFGIPILVLIFGKSLIWVFQGFK